ncbi:MAG: prenyltransferase [Flavobacterium sp.]|nr:MAG: prenyltransferase [Flavobacterium sp.]
MAYLKIIRPVNLLLIALVQILIKFVLFDTFRVVTAMNTFQFLWLLLATLAIAAAGNVVNDIYDLEIDKINKPSKVLIGRKISEKRAFTYFIILNSIGVISGFVLANQLGKSGLAAIFIVISALLYMYATQLKAMLITGNIVISLLVAFSLLIVLVFDLYPIGTNGLSEAQNRVSRLVLDYAIFAFVINFMREIVKDLEDINGDKKGDIRTLAIAIGRKRTTTLVFVIASVFIMSIILYVYTFLYDKQLMVLYFLFLIVAPLIYFCIRAWGAASQKEYAAMSVILKVTMFTGMCSMVCYTFI